MRIQIKNAFDIPDTLASLIVGAPLNSTLGGNDFVLTMDEDGAKRFSNILYYIYSDSEKYKEYRQGISVTSQKAVLQEPTQQLVPQTQLQKHEKIIEPVSAKEMKDSGKMNIAALKSKSKKLLSNGG